MSNKKKNEKFSGKSSNSDIIKIQEDKKFEELLSEEIESGSAFRDSYLLRAVTRIRLNDIQGAVEDFIYLIEPYPIYYDAFINDINGYNLDFQSMLASGHKFTLKEKKSIDKLNFKLEFLNLIIDEINKNDEDDIDLPSHSFLLSLYSVIDKRVKTGNTIEKNKSKQSLDNFIKEQIYRYANEDNSYYYDDDNNYIISIIKNEVIGFGILYDIIFSISVKLENLALQNKTVNPHRFEINNKLIHAKASLYGIIKFALSKGITAELIKEWYDNFIYDEELIEGIEPFDNIENRI
jgi:hypothetical protein